MPGTPTPLTCSNFRVDWGGTTKRCAEVNGLSMFLTVLEYRSGNDLNATSGKMPDGLAHYTNIVLRRPLMAGDNDFFNWMKATKVNAVGQQQDIQITLLNEALQAVYKWGLRSAWPCRLSYSSLNSLANAVVMEELEIAYLGLELAAPL